MPNSETSQNILVTHAAMTGLTPLIPIPFVDDQVYAYFLRSMVERLAATHSVSLQPAALQILTAQRGSGCPLGCVGNVLLYPIKKIFRKIFFFLEIKRAADIISHTYYFGYLLDVALQEGWLTPASASRVRSACDRVLTRTNTSLVNRAAYGVVSQSKGALRSASALLRKHLPSKASAADTAKVAEQVASVADEEQKQMRGIISQLQAALTNLPAEHFDELRAELKKEWEATGQTGTPNF